MISFELSKPGSKSTEYTVPDDCIFGKSSECDFRLDHWRVGKTHFRLFNTPSGIFVEDLGSFGGTAVNGQRIELQHGPLSPMDVVSAGPFKVTLGSSQSNSLYQHRPSENVQIQHEKNWQRRASDSTHGGIYTPEDIQGARTYGRRSRDREYVVDASDSSSPKASVRERSAPDGRAKISGDFTSPNGHADADAPPQLNAALKAIESEWRSRLHGLLLESMDLRRSNVSAMSDERLRLEASTLMDSVMSGVLSDIPKELSPKLLRKQVIDEAVGLGPLEELLADDSISEVMVNRYDHIYVERKGRLVLHPLTFTSEKAVLSVIERIVAPIGRHVDESSPMVDARLKDGSRVNAIIPPLAINGSAITIRKFPKHKLTAKDVIGFGTCTAEMMKFLQICVEAKKNVIISGGTGSGKTSLLNILSNFIPAGERVITVEDAAELKLNHQHLISLESRPSNAEGKGAIPIRELVKNVLRMRPDRVIIGECRGAEALDMLQAMNTGHEGSLTTLHANTPRDALSRLETMILMAGVDLPLQAIREQISSAIDIIVQQTRFSCGSRVITYITEVGGMEGGKMQLQDLFQFAHKGYSSADDSGIRRVRGGFTGCGIIPSFYEDLLSQGESFDLRYFSPIDSSDSDA